MSSSSPGSEHVVDGSNAGKPPYSGSFSESLHSLISMKVTFHSKEDTDDFIRSETEIPYYDGRVDSTLEFVLDNTVENVAMMLQWKRKLAGDARVKGITLFVTIVHSSTTTIAIP